MQKFNVNAQRGASITTIMLLLIAFGILAKLGVAIIPDQISNYQLNKLVAQELKQANNDRLTDRQFIDKLDRQLSINASYNTKAADVVHFTNKTPGALAARVKYDSESQFYKNIYVVNRFDTEVVPANAK